MSAGARVGLVLIALSLLFSSSRELYAADTELTHPPVVTSMTGPTSGYVGTSYSFTGVVTSTSEYALSQVTLYATESGLVTKNAGDSGCTTTSCTLAGTFTPSATGTFNIYLRVTYSDGGSSYQCDSLPNDLTNDCQSSTTQYIAFVALAAPTTPVVTSITGPTSGVIREEYTFSATVVGTEAIPTDGVVIRQYNSDDVDVIIASIDQGDSGCTATSCSVTGTFTPTISGTYIVYIATGTSPSCSTAPEAGLPCSYSSGKYITFVVTDGSGALPSAGILSNQTRNIFIGLGFIFLGILTTQTSKILDTLGLSREKIAVNRRSKFEKKF